MDSEGLWSTKRAWRSASSLWMLFFTDDLSEIIVEFYGRSDTLKLKSGGY